VPEQASYASALSEPNALLILLDEHHTSVSMVRHSHLQWTRPVEIGERDIICAAAGVFDMRGRQAYALMEAYRARQLQTSVELRLARAYWAELRKWMTDLAEAISSAETNRPMPHSVCFLDRTGRIREAIQSLQTPFWEKSLPFERCPEVIPLSTNNLRDVLDCTSQAVDPTYLPVRGLAHYAADLFAPGKSLDRALMERIHWRRHKTSTRSR